MILATDRPKRPALRFLGAKFRLGKDIISYWPNHTVRLITNCGSLSDEIQAPICTLTTAVDLDGRLINFFKILREQPNELIRYIRLTPWHEGEYKLSKVKADDPIEDARRFFFLCWSSINGGPNPNSSGFRFQKHIESRRTTPAKDAIDIDHLYVVSDRIKHIQFLQCDMFDVIPKFKDTEDCFIYCDPPYMLHKRTATPRYNHEPEEIDQMFHEKVSDSLMMCEIAMRMICGYQSTLYENLYESNGWKRIDFGSDTNGGGKRIDSICLCPNLQKRLGFDFSDLPLFRSGV